MIGEYRDIKPECRHCGERVEHFGDICGFCAGIPDEKDEPKEDK